MVKDWAGGITKAIIIAVVVEVILIILSLLISFAPFKRR
jgi:hypothetical protein